MTLEEFLQLLVPPGVLVAAKLVSRTDPQGKPFKTFVHKAARLHTDFARSLENMDQEQANTYFALASYKQGFHAHPTTGKKQLRVRDNAAALKAFWYDIDFVQKGKSIYTDVGDVGRALKAFSQATSIPLPALIVGTGNGLHAYWPLDEAVTPDQWQVLAEAMKAAAQQNNLHIDPTRTADAASVLRPIHTSNWKDPANPKPVKVLYSSGQIFSYTQMEALLQPWVGATRTYSAPLPGIYNELTGGLNGRGPTGSFETVIKHCAVARMIAETHGKACPEPLWVASLQLLKYCEDGEAWVHPVSDGHPGYTAADTDRKWQHRLANAAGPTLCSTFETYEDKICAKCPHHGFVKTPLQLGNAEVVTVGGLPTGWRIAPENRGIERLMIDPTNNQKEWVKVLRHVPLALRATRSVVTQRYDLALDVEFANSKPWSINFPGATLGNLRKLNETLADYGVVLKEKETKSFGDLMATWLGQLQAARRVADVTEQLGWLIDKTPTGEQIVGFSAGPTTYYADGRVRSDVRAAREFGPIAKFYEPKGGLDAWKQVATFLSDQDLPAFTAIVAAAFGTPLLRFTGLSGGILSIVSTASGVGKSSALKCSQAVWGSPTHGVNAVDDTPKSVARKLGFLNNLPAYWDELRGRKTVDDFLTLAFQITQGKEKTRLDSSAQLREVSTWETMLVVASNESIFEAMARQGGGSDAGIVRTFEIVVEPFASERNRAELSLMFEALNSNYGHAGRIYAQYLATNSATVEERVKDMFQRLARGSNMEAQERFWFAIVSILMVGAQLAGELDLVHINVQSLLRFLVSNIYRLRGRSVDAMTLSQPAEILASFMAAYQDRGLTVDRFPTLKANIKTYIPDITGGIPRSDKITYHVSRSEELIRIPRAELERWLEYRGLPIYSIMKRFKDDFGAIETRAKLGVGTKWELPAQRLVQLDLKRFGLSAASIPKINRHQVAANLQAPDISQDQPPEVTP